MAGKLKSTSLGADFGDAQLPELLEPIGSVFIFLDAHGGDTRAKVVVDDNPQLLAGLQPWAL